MKTYIVNSGNSKTINLVAVRANNKNEAYEKVKSKKGSAQKGSIQLSSVDLDYCVMEKVI